MIPTVEDDVLLKRAVAAYFRGSAREHFIADQPSNNSYVKRHGGKEYVVLLGGRGDGPLAVYRLSQRGVLKRLERWPSHVERY